MRLLRRKLELEESGLHEDVDAEDFRDAFCSVGRRILAFLISAERQAIAAVLAELPDARHDAWTSTYAVGLRAIDALLAHPGAAIALRSRSCDVPSCFVAMSDRSGGEHAACS
jgi:hypothetical protein